MAFGIEQEQQGAFRVLALSGRLDTETSADLELALQDLQASGAAHFLIDLAAIGYVSSAGLRVLLALAKQLDGGRGSLRLCGLNAAVAQVFDVAGFSQMFAIFPTRAAALGVNQAPVDAPPDTTLARRAADLLGVPEPDTDSGAASADLARAAARLLGVGKTAEPAAAPVAEAPKARAPKPPKPAGKSSVPKPVAAEESAGVLGKLRGLFGNKR